MSDNIYKTPESELVKESQDGYELASRMSRLGASILDGLTIACVTLPLMYFTGGFDGITTGVQPSFGYSLMIGIAGMIAFFVYNMRLLTRDGQTIGKRLLGIRIVDLDNNVPKLKPHLLVRYLTYFLPGQIPIVGQIFSLVNILFIFGKERRCLHDIFAGTRVIAK